MTIYFYGAGEVPYGCFSNFSGHGFDLDGHWWMTSEHYFQAQKFSGTRHADIRAILLGTGDEEIVEDTSTDHYWGRGRTGTGKNMLGRILMRTRAQLRADLTQNADTQGR